MMQKTQKIENIKNCLPEMGLTDRFFYLVNELYREYFDAYNEYFEYGFEDKNLKHWEEANYLHEKFLQNFGDSKLKHFILSEIQELTSIFRQKYSFELSYLYNRFKRKNFYLSNDSEFLVLAPFFFDELSLKDVIHHELSISEVDDRKYLLDKYNGAISEIKYRINSNYVWDAGNESERFVINDDIVFPERNILDLDSLSAYLLELQEKSINPITSEIFGNERKEEEKINLQAIHPEKMVQVFSRILNRNDEEQLIKNFVATTFSYNFRKHLFDYEDTFKILDLKNVQNTALIGQTIVLMMKLSYLKDAPASYITRVLIASLKRDNINQRVGLSDDLRKRISSEWRIMSKTDLAMAIGFSSDMEFILFLSSSN